MRQAAAVPGFMRVERSVQAGGHANQRVVGAPGIIVSAAARTRARRRIPAVSQSLTLLAPFPEILPGIPDLPHPQPVIRAGGVVVRAAGGARSRMRVQVVTAT